RDRVGDAGVDDGVRRRGEGGVVRVVEIRARGVAADGADGEARGRRVFDRLVDDDVRRQQRLDVAERERRGAGPRERVVVDVVELRPFGDAVAAEVRVRLQAQPRRRLPREVELDSAAVAAIDVAAEQQADVGELAGRSDLVAELHGVDVRREVDLRRAEVPAGFEVVHALGTYGMRVVSER